MSKSPFHSMVSPIPEQISESIFAKCWANIVTTVHRELALNFNPKKDLSQIGDVSAHVAEMLISDIVIEQLQQHDLPDENTLFAYKRVFIELITPFSQDHHEIACSMLAPNLMTFEMLNAFMESWLYTSFGLLQQSSNPKTLIERCIYDICLAMNVRFNPYGLDLLVGHLVGLMQHYEINPPEKFFIDYLLYKPVKRPLLSELLQEQLMGEVIDELSSKLIEETISLDGGAKKETVVIKEYKKRVHYEHEGIFVTDAGQFITCVKDMLVYKPYNCLKYVTIRIKGKKANVNDLPFGLLGLMAHKAFFSTVMVKKTECPYGSHKYTITQISSSVELMNLCYISYAYHNCQLSGYLSYLNRQDFINYLVPKSVKTFEKSYQFKNKNWSEIISKSSDFIWIIQEDGTLYSEEIPRKQIGFTSEIHVSSEGELYS